MPTSFKNIGPVSQEWLRAVGIHSYEDLAAVGSVAAYLRVKAHGFNASLNLLYALEAALRQIHWTTLPVADKQKLRQQAQTSSASF